MLPAAAIARCTLWHDAVMALKRLGFVAAQLMPKPGARQVLARVVPVDDLRGDGTVLREHDADIEAFPGAGRVWAHEQHTIGPDGEGVARMLAAACGAYVIVVSASGSPEWAWDSVVSVAWRQAGLLAA